MTKKLKAEDAVKDEHSFISDIESRSPRVKSHATLGQAKGAVSWRFNEANSLPVGAAMKILERNDQGKWIELYTVDPEDTEQPWGRPELPGWLKR